MNETKVNHTPEPWQIIRRDGMIFLESQGIILLRAKDDIPHLKTEGEHSANLLLIATSPELLEQLQALVVQLESMPGMIVPPKVRAVLAKATGQTNEE